MRFPCGVLPLSALRAYCPCCLRLAPLRAARTPALPSSVRSPRPRSPASRSRPRPPASIRGCKRPSPRPADQNSAGHSEADRAEEDRGRRAVVLVLDRGVRPDGHPTQAKLLPSSAAPSDTLTVSLLITPALGCSGNIPASWGLASPPPARTTVYVVNRGLQHGDPDQRRHRHRRHGHRRRARPGCHRHHLDRQSRPGPRTTCQAPCRDADQHRDQHRGQGHQGRDEPQRDRHHAERQDRLRRQLRRPDRHADQHRDQHRRQAHQDGSHPPRHRDHPASRTAYVANAGAENVPHSATVTPIRVATNTAGKPIGLACPAPSHRDHPERQDRLRSHRPGGHRCTDQHRHRAGKPISIGDYAQAITITPDGRTAYVNEIQPQGIFLVAHQDRYQHTRQANQGRSPQPVAITPDSRTVYAPTLPDTLDFISTATNVALQGDQVGNAHRSHRDHPGRAGPCTSPTTDRRPSPRSVPPPTRPARRSRSEASPGPSQ